jgi:hypothetical protein
MPSQIKVDQIAGATGSTVTLPSGQTLDLSSGTVTLPSTALSALNATNLTSGTVPSARLSLTSADLPTVPTTKGGTGLTTIGTALQVLRVNSGATGLEYGTVSSKLIGVTQVVKTDTETFSGLSTTFSNITGLGITITPQSASSKFLLIPSVYISSASNPSQSRLARDGTALFIGDAASSRKRVSGQYFGAGGNIEGFHHCYQFLDSPNTTSSITYNLQISIGGGATHYVNRTSRDYDAASEDARCASSFIIMEIGA